MAVQPCQCPGTHHLEASALRRAPLIEHDGRLFTLLDGHEYHLIAPCPEWPALIAARLVPQDQAARASTRA